MQLLRAHVFHTPRRVLECHWDGGLLIEDGRIAGCGEYGALAAAHPSAETVDLSGGFLLPGLIDAHVHFPQLRIIGRMGRSLLDWLEQCALPEEARMADVAYARNVARGFVGALVSHGTTTALVFGAHFAPATAALFEAAQSAGLRVISGLVLSDRQLCNDLHQTPEDVYRLSKALIARFPNYAVTPRFAASTSEAMLEVCQTLLREHRDLWFQTHINEQPGEIEEVARLFPWAPDYLAVYERFGLGGRRAVMAHNVHATGSELERLAAAGTSIAHCPSSNAMLGSGIFPFRRHVEAGVRCALGTDVGAGTGFGVLKEALAAYLMQRLAPDGFELDAGYLLYLATLAGAEALGMDSVIGSFDPGKSADFVYLRAPETSVLAAVLERVENPQDALSALFTLAGSESVREVRVDGHIVWPAAGSSTT